MDAPDVTPIVIGPGGKKFSVSINSPCCRKRISQKQSNDHMHSKSNLPHKPDTDGRIAYTQFVGNSVAGANTLFCVDPVGRDSLQFGNLLQMAGVARVPSSNNKDQVQLFLHQTVYGVLSLLNIRKQVKKRQVVIHTIQWTF